MVVPERRQQACARAPRVVVGVLAIVYLIVVPSYQRSLENQELRSLASSLQKVVLPQFPAEFDLRAQYVNEMAPAVDARVAVLDVARRQRAARAERRLEPRRTLVGSRGGSDRAFSRTGAAG